MSLPYKYCAVSMSDLVLDAKNPRFASSTLVDSASKVPEQQDIIRHFLKYADVCSLASNIERVHCLHGSEMITCYETDGELIVAEGNRRVCACKLLLDPTLVPDEYADSFPRASKETRENIKVVMVNLYPDKESVQAYLSDRHIVGVRKWSALEKNNYYMNLFQQYGDVNIVKTYTSDPLSVVKKCIIKYQFFMTVFNVLTEQGAALEIEKIDYLPLADRFMDILVGDDPEVGLSLRLDESNLLYSCPENKLDLYHGILSLVGEAFLIRKLDDENPKITGVDVSNSEKRKKLITDDIRIPGLYSLIKQFKEIAGSDSSQTEGGLLAPPSPSPSSNRAYDFFVPDRYVPRRQVDRRLVLTTTEAGAFVFDDGLCDKKIQQILRELAKMTVSEKPVACACLFRCLLEMCTRRVYDKCHSSKPYAEGQLSANLLHANNSLVFAGETGPEPNKIRTAIKEKIKSGLIDTLNLYIHYPQSVDTTYVIDAWGTMKNYIIRCLNI